MVTFPVYQPDGSGLVVADAVITGAVRSTFTAADALLLLPARSEHVALSVSTPSPDDSVSVVQVPASRPEPPMPSVHPHATETVVLFQPAAFCAGDCAGLDAGACLSTRLPAIGPATAQFPRASHTSRVAVAASVVCVPEDTAVVSTKLASAGLASPEASVAVHAMATSVLCQTPSAAAQLIAGGSTSPDDGSKTAKGESDVTSPQTMSAAVSCVVVTSTHAPPSKW